MKDDIKIVEQHYNNDVELEWKRLEEHPFEFAITTRFMDRYIKAGDKVLDIGGGPGRYSLYYAKKGCDVTLYDLSSGNVGYTLEKAKKDNLSIKGYVGDATVVNEQIHDTFDHVFLMGPLYHLLDEEDRKKAIDAALSLLKPGGIIYISFILMFSGMIYCMKNSPEILLDPMEEKFIKAVIENKSYVGDAFTKACFMSQNDLKQLVEGLPTKKLHLFGQEGILGPCEPNFLAQPKEVIDLWISLSEKLCEREELLSYSEHAMYIGKKEI